MRRPVAACPPRLRTQLDNGFSTRSVDCNVECTGMCIEEVTGERLTARQIRNIAGWPNGPTAISLSKRAFESRNIRARYFYGASVETLKGLLAEDYFVVLFVDYGKVNNLRREYSGAKTYDGVHAIGLCGWWRRKRDGMRRTWLFDPLHDGRRDNIPDGPIKVDFWVFREAAEKFAGANKFSGYAVKKPTRVIL